MSPGFTHSVSLFLLALISFRFSSRCHFFFLRLNSEAFGFPPFPYGFSSAKINKLFFAPRSKAAWNGGFFHCFSVCSRSNLTICSVICDVVQEEEKINPDKRFTFKGNIFVVKTNYLQKNQQHFMIWEISLKFNLWFKFILFFWHLRIYFLCLRFNSDALKLQKLL